MNKDELGHALTELQEGNLSDTRQYEVLHEFGKVGYLAARPTVERFLTSPEMGLRYIALEVLVQHWRLAEHEGTALRALEGDSSAHVRVGAATSLGVLKRDSKDRKTLAALAHVVRNQEELRAVRQAAYAAMRAILRYDPWEQLRLSARRIDLSQDIDWKLVDAY